MGFLQNVFELVRDNSFQQVEEEAGKEVAIALAGNGTEVRDRLNKALSTRLESLWTPSPFRLVETNERPSLDGDSEAGGLLLYALYQGERIPDEKKNWLLGLVAAPEVSALVVTLPRQKDEPFETQKKQGRGFNPLRLIAGNENSPNAPSDKLPAPPHPSWETDLEEFVNNSERLSLVNLSGLLLEELQRELLPQIVRSLPGRELALARRAPIFRNTVAAHFVARAARDNAETVLLANATANIPFLADIFGGGADFVLLSKNQFELSHRLAAIYGQKRAHRVEIFVELAPILGAAFLWRAFSRAATRKLPYFLAILPKAAIAYGATYAVGKVAEYYYSNGRTAPTEIAALVRGAFERLKNRASEPDQGKGGESPRRLRSV